MKTLAKTQVARLLNKQDGIVGYGVAWLLGVPLSVLVVIYLIFGR